MKPKTAKWLPLLASMVIAAALIVCMALLLVPVNAPQQAKAASTDGYSQYTWGTYNLTTTAFNGAGKVTADYGVLECYLTIDVTLAQAVTVTMQHSPNNSVWADQPGWQFATNVLAVGAGFAGVHADGTTFAIFDSYGMYTRPAFAVSTANPYTITLRCIAKDKPGQDLDVMAGALESTD
jgi:hypothetical protein